jgi:NitT/TauT family transport system substrate-binding protein
MEEDMQRYMKSKLLSLLCGALVTATPAIAQEKLNFVLNWLPGADHAPIFYAEKMGWYKQAGLDLTIENGKGSGYSAQKLASGASDVGIVDMMTAFQVRSKGAEMTAVMALYVNSPFGFYWKKSSGIKGPKDFVGKKIGVPPGDAVRTVWPAIAGAFGIPEDSVTWVNVAPEGKIAALQSGAIDVTSHFYSVHYVYERTFGNDMGHIAMRNVGFNPYSNSIFANPKATKSKAAAIEKFVNVTQRAYVTCLANPAPCNETLAQVASQKVEDVAAGWNNVKEIVVDEASRKIAFGYLVPERMEGDYKFALTVYEDMKPFPLKDFYTNEFLDKSLKVVKVQ